MNTPSPNSAPAIWTGGRRNYQACQRRLVLLGAFAHADPLPRALSTLLLCDQLIPLVTSARKSSLDPPWLWV